MHYPFALECLVVLILFVIVFKKYILLKCKQIRALRNLPGPTAFPIIGNLLEIITCEDLLLKFINLTEKYDGLMRLWFGADLYIFVSKPEYVNTLISSTKIKRRGRIYKHMKGVFGNSFIAGSGQQRINQRKAVLPSMQFNSLSENYLKNISNVCNIFVKKLKPFAENGNIFNIANKIGLCALHIACEVILGIKSFQQSDDMIPVVIALRESFSTVVRKTASSLYKFEIFDFFTGEYQLHKKHLEIVNQFCQKVLDEKNYLNEENDGKIIIDKILEVTEADTFNRLKSVNGITLIAQDTVTMTSGLLLTVLAIHQDYQRKVQEEIDQIFGEDENINLTADVFDRMIVLDLCMKEILRLYPVAPALVRELDEDIQLTDKITLPSGAIVSILLLGMHTSPKIWDKPHEFIPERFMPEACMKRPTNSFVPHSRGSLGCIGKSYANISIKAITIAVLKNYNVECDYTNIAEIVTHPSKRRQPDDGFPLRLIARKKV